MTTLRGNTGGGIGALRVMSILTPDKIPDGSALDKRRLTANLESDKLGFQRFSRVPTSTKALWPLALKFAPSMLAKKPIVLQTEGLAKALSIGNVILLVDRHATSNSSGGFEHVAVLLGHFKLGWLLHHFRPRMVWALYVFVNGFLTLALLALLAVVTDSPFVFPSLGPTAYLLFITALAETSSPRNTIPGHAIGLICGYAAFSVTGAANIPFGMHAGVYWPRILAAALSLSATGAFMVLFRASHPPAGATTLIVSLGIIAKPKVLVIIEAAVVLLVAQALVINRLAGLPYPIWRFREISKT